MQITVNGEAREVADNITAGALIDSMDLTGKRLAMEVNREIVPRSSFDSHRLQPGDTVEIRRASFGSFKLNKTGANLSIRVRRTD